MEHPTAPQTVTPGWVTGAHKSEGALHGPVIGLTFDTEALLHQITHLTTCRLHH